MSPAGMAYEYEPLVDPSETGDSGIRVAALQPSLSSHAELQIELIIRPRWLDDSDSDESEDADSEDNDTDASAVQINLNHEQIESSGCRTDESASEGSEEPDEYLSALKPPYPKYEALSYVWGSPNDPSYVRVISGANPDTLSITRNLDVALRHLRQPFDVRYLWIDALCINQADLEEKSSQVKYIGNVYIEATRTIAWLGPKADDSDTAILDLQSMYNHISGGPDHNQRKKIEYHTKEQMSERNFFNRFLDRVEDSVHDVMFKLEKIIPLGYDVLSEWDPSQVFRVYSLLSRPYFERAWIQQEINLSEPIVFQCGDSTFAEEVLWKGASHLLSQFWDTSVEQSVTFSEWRRVLDRVWRIGNIKSARLSLKLVDLRYELCDVKCQDPRDRLFSVSGMIRIHDKFIFADYTKTVEETYKKVAQHHIERYRGLELLRCCELSTRVLQIPSWVPDWSTAPLYGQHHPLQWSACAFISARRYPIESELRCPASGVCIDRVSKVISHSIDWHEGLHDLQTDIKRNIISVLELLYAIKPSEQVLASPYRTGESVYEAYCRLLTWDQLRDTQPPWGPTDAFNDGVAYLVQIWSSDITAIEEFYEAWTKDDAMNHKVLTMTQGKHFIETENGYVGWAPISTEVGDTVCVLLGANVPLVLRQATTSDDRSWLVVGPAYVQGLMYGEAIYRDRHLQAYTFGSTRGLDLELIDSLEIGYQGANEATVEVDPVVLLEQAGINVESYDGLNHKLVVRETSLRAAGIPIEVFRLV